jgi:hypothetical protein
MVGIVPKLASILEHSFKQKVEAFLETLLEIAYNLVYFSSTSQNSEVVALNQPILEKVDIFVQLLMHQVLYIF